MPASAVKTNKTAANFTKLRAGLESVKGTAEGHIESGATRGVVEGRPLAKYSGGAKKYLALENVPLKLSSRHMCLIVGVPDNMLSIYQTRGE